MTPSDPRFEELSDSPVDPGDIASAARSCSVVLVIGAVLLAIACVALGLTLVR